MMQLYSHNQAQAHRQPTRHWSRLLMAASLAIAASSAAWAADLTPAQRAAFAAEMAQVRAFMLTDRFIDKYLAAAADPDYPVAALDGMIVGTDDDDDDADEGDEDDYSADDDADEYSADDDADEYSADDDADEYSAEEGDEDEEEPSQSLAQMIGEIEAVPGATDFLARHGLSVRDFVLGRGMMTYAAILHAQQQDPGLFERDELEVQDIDFDVIVSPANLAVYVRNKDKIERTMMAVGKRRLGWSNLDMDRLAECTQVGLIMGAVTVVLVAVGYGAAVEGGDPSLTVKAADNIEDLGKALSNIPPREAIIQLAQGLRLHGTAVMTPAIEKPLSDITHWVEDNCSEEALRGGHGDE